MDDKVKALEKDLQDRDAKIKRMEGQLASLKSENDNKEGAMKQKIQGYKEWDCYTNKRLQDKKTIIKEIRKRREADIAKECEEVTAKMQEVRQKLEALQQKVGELSK